MKPKWILCGLLLITGACRNESAVRTVDLYEKGVIPVKTEKALFGAGCFWGVEAAFRAVPGVVRTRVGYTGGTTANPTYEEVCGHLTGHAEAVEVLFDPKQVSYEQLLNVFWDQHNPTTLNRQGLDVGSQYRSVIFYTTPEQQQTAERSKKQIQKTYRRPIVTQIVPEEIFWPAEDYHQQYLEKRGKAQCP
jgi:peptide-methionine (S)-S-oxide reductase